MTYIYDVDRIRHRYKQEEIILLLPVCFIFFKFLTATLSSGHNRNATNLSQVSSAFFRLLSFQQQTFVCGNQVKSS